MGLIDSPRLTQQDRAAWSALERYDRQLADSPTWPAREHHAHQIIRDFAAAGECYASTSWGKDSTCLAHLVATSGIRLPLVYVRMKTWENPDCLTVRDVFLAKYGDLVDYHEYSVTGGTRWWHAASAEQLTQNGSHVGSQFAEAEQRHGRRHITGVRGEESRIRRMAMGKWGESGLSACRPVGNWTAIDIYAYLHRHNLPIHPAYAMSFGGKLDRRWLRVSPIGGISSAHKQRAEWEQRYYPELVRLDEKEGTP